MNNKTIISIILVATLVIGMSLLAYSLLSGPVPTVSADDSILSFRGGKEETVSAYKDISITVYDKRVDFLEIEGQIYLNGEPIGGMSKRLRTSVLYMSNIYYIGDFVDGYQFINSNNCDLFPIHEDINLTLQFNFAIPSQYCTCRGDYTFTFIENLRIGMETEILCGQI